MEPIELVVFFVFSLIPFWSFVNSSWDFFTHRRQRPFIKARLEIARLNHRVAVPNPRDRKP